jgi:histidine ammonia-lyase
MILVIGKGPVLLSQIAAASQVAITPETRMLVAAARAVVDAYATLPEPIYGLNTGLGGNVGFRLDPAALEAFQVQMVRGRNIGMGPVFPERVARAQFLCRIVGLAQGGAGISPAVLNTMIAMFNAGVIPSIPGRGSIGAGDLGLCGHIGAVVIGRGLAWCDGALMPGAAALAAAGIAPAVLGPKDGLGLLNSSCVTCGHAAHVLAALGDLLVLSIATAALAMEGYAANPSVFDVRIANARPATGQVQAAAIFRNVLAGSALYDGASRSIQDALCFRVLPQIYGPVLAAFDTAVAAVTIEINAASDNPLVLIDDRLILSTANFHTPSIALAFDTLAIAICHLSTAGMQRIVKLMNPGMSGLPKYLSPVGGASSGLNSLQKTASYLHGEIRLKATPASLDTIPVSETVEDHAPNTPLCVRKLEEQLLPWGMLLAIEAMTAAQAVDLRGAFRLAPATARLHTAVRDAVPMLETDRETGPDADAVYDSITNSTVVGDLKRFLTGLPLNPLLSSANSTKVTP